MTRGVRPDLSGQTFGHWSVIGKAENDENRKGRWLCKCDCGTERVVAGYLLTRATKPSRSCGCQPKHFVHGLWNTPTMSSWRHMKARCEDPSDKDYERYGAQGRKVTFQRIEDLVAEIGLRPPGTTIDRIDNDLGYEPGNVRWAPPDVQAINRGPKPLHAPWPEWSVDCDDKDIEFALYSWLYLQ